MQDNKSTEAPRLKRSEETLKIVEGKLAHHSEGDPEFPKPDAKDIAARIAKLAHETAIIKS